MGKRFLGKVGKERHLMHRISDAIIYALTGHRGMFLSKLAYVGDATGHKEIYASDYDGAGARIDQRGDTQHLAAHLQCGIDVRADNHSLPGNDLHGLLLRQVDARQ